MGCFGKGSGISTTGKTWERPENEPKKARKKPRKGLEKVWKTPGKGSEKSYKTPSEKVKEIAIAPGVVAVVCLVSGIILRIHHKVNEKCRHLQFFNFFDAS